MKKIGFFGGTFDPIHLGHLNLAKALLKMKKVDEMAFVVADDPPHKTTLEKNPFALRFQMVELALADEEKMFASNLESELKLRYSIDSLNAFAGLYPNDQVVLIIGSDSLEQLHTWKSAQELLANYPIITYPRPEVSLTHLSDFWTPLEKQKLRATLQPDLKMIDISSTLLRQYFSTHDEKHQYISDAVHAFIILKHLYKT